MDLVDDDGLYREDGMWNTYFHLKKRVRETVARFDDIFDLCSLVRLRFICQIWHIFTSIWGHVSNLSRLQIDFRFTTIRLITISMNIFKFTFCTVTEFNICTTVYQLSSFQTFAISSQSSNSLELDPPPQSSRTKLSWFTTYECTVAPVRLYSAGLPTARPNNRFRRPSRLAPSTEFWSVWSEWGEGREEQSETECGPGVWISRERAWHRGPCCPAAAAGVKLSTLSTFRQPALARLDSGAFYYRLLLGVRAKICSFITRDTIRSTWLWWRAIKIFRQNVSSQHGKIN